MSRKKNSNLIVTKLKHIKIGRRILKNNEPVVLVGPDEKNDIITLQELAVELYGPGTQCLVIPGDNAVRC